MVGPVLSPILLILVPLSAAFLIVLLSSVLKQHGPVLAFLALAAEVVMAISIYPAAAAAPIEVVIAGVRAPVGINLIADPLSMLMVLVVVISALLVSLYSFSYIRDEQKSRYSALFLLLVTGAVGMLLTGDIFNLFVFFEILCISSYILVAYHRGGLGLEASIKYLILGSVGSLFILISIGMIYGALGTLNMAHIGANIDLLPEGTRLAAAAFFLVGLGVEAAVFPLNSWLPDAHASAPSSISAVLSGFVIEVALIVMIRVAGSVFQITQVFPVLMVVGVITLLIGEFAANRQPTLKRMLAYSSIGQIGLILFALSVGTPDASSGALLQVINHAAAKSVLFLVAGYYIMRTGSGRIEDYAGLGRKMPVASFLFVLAFLSLIGVPPLLGFFSKFSIITSALSAGTVPSLFMAGLVLVGTVVEVVYFIRVMQVLYSSRQQSVSIESGIPAGALVSILLFSLAFAAGAAILTPLTQAAGSAAAVLF
ncbi:MAG: hypothetical protein K9L68_12690 [Spirochaetales bacterium]|nr:hypothetical protein [Spirochaetales bacterium]MCF7939449.1 hypothetical protein [Spirochaetales bacterium]